MQFKNKLSRSSSGDSSAGSSRPLDVADVPDAILEVINLARQLGEPGQQIIARLRPVLATMAAAAEQLAECETPKISRGSQERIAQIIEDDLRLRSYEVEANGRG